MRRTTLTWALLLATFAGLSAGAAVAGADVRTLGAPAPLPPGAELVGAAAESRELNLMVALRPRDPGALERFATAVSTPGSPQFRDYLTVPEFARRFGATPAQVASVRAALERRGLEVGRAGRNNLSLRVRTTVGEAEDAFGLTVQRVALRSGRVAYRNNRAPALPAVAAPFVEAVVGLENVTESSRQGEAEPLPDAAATAAEAVPQVATGGPQPCPEALQFREAEGGYTADQIAAAYQLPGFYAGGNFGAGQKIALLELEPYLPADIAKYQSCFGTDVQITNVDVAGGPGPYEGEDGESSLDIEQLIGLAPGAEIVVYQGPNSAEAQVFAAYVEQNVAKVMSSSWGACEHYTEKAEMAAFDTLLQEAAAQGQSFFVAAGDDGSEDCYDNDPEDKFLSVDTPGTQPFATDVGGTRLQAPGTPRIEYLWNDGPKGGAGGGGVSQHFPMPAYQAEAAPGLGVVSALSTGSTCGFSGLCRQVPDVSANASPETGYIVHSEGEWQLVGGTSAAAPLWAALATLTNASPGCQGYTIGFANPALYRIAGSSSYPAAFQDIVAGRPGHPQTNDMLFGGTKPFPAGPGYDMATGLGSPNGPALAAALCAIATSHAVAVSDPGRQRGVVGQKVSLPIKAVDARGDALTFLAAGLPAGLAIDPASGVISGKPKQAGTTTVSVSARDRLANAGSTEFTWRVKPAKPELSRAKLSGFGAGRPKLSFALAARTGSSLLRVAVKLPPSLTAADSRHALGQGLAVFGPKHKRVGAEPSVRGRWLEIQLPRRLPAASFRIAAPALQTGDEPPQGALRLLISAAETGKHGARFALRLRP